MSVYRVVSMYQTIAFALCELQMLYSTMQRIRESTHVGATTENGLLTNMTRLTIINFCVQKYQHVLYTLYTQ
jgi:hypothetical protein